MEHHEVSPLELFFDLVFVFAITQLSQHLLGHLDWRGLAETLVMLVGVFGVWSYMSFEASFEHASRAHVQRVMLIVMAFGLFMNAAIAHAFEGGALAFAVASPLLPAVAALGLLALVLAVLWGVVARENRLAAIH